MPPDAVWQKAFEGIWPNIEKGIQAALNLPVSGSAPASRTSEDLLSEVLELSRVQNTRLGEVVHYVDMLGDLFGDLKDDIKKLQREVAPLTQLQKANEARPRTLVAVSNPIIPNPIVDEKSGRPAVKKSAEPLYPADDFDDSDPFADE